ncbi:MAG TPA: hypothetical protein VEQ62_15185, partial [Stellaceae bacterium]|nr:hypothetical protein [Stellaceae bacterium]
HEPAKDSCPHALRSLLRDDCWQTGFWSAVFRDYTGASFRTRSVPWNALPGIERQRKVGDREVLID